MIKKSELLRLHEIDHVINERNVLVELEHPFICNLGGSFQDVRYIYIALEYVIGGEFLSHLRKVGRFDHLATKFYGSQIILALEYMHSLDFIYRDLKPENLLMDKKGYLKLTDFGFAKKVEFSTYTLCGTPEYIAPEILLNRGHGRGVDWWSLGVLFFELMSGYPPFYDEDPLLIYQKILAGKVTFPRHFNIYAKSFVKKLLVANLNRRFGCLKAGADDIKRHKLYHLFDWEAAELRKIIPPVVPLIVKGDKTDTKNFDKYPDSLEEAPLPAMGQIRDPFQDF
jgi:serine/threonine protein kinase